MASRLYSTSNKIRFTSIPEKYAVPRQFKAKLSEVHSSVVSYVADRFVNTRKYRQQVTDALNYLTFCILQSQPPTFSWVASDPLNTMPNDVDFDVVESELGQWFLTEEAIEWDVSPSDTFISPSNDIAPDNLPLQNSNTISPKSRGDKSAIVDKVSTPVQSSTSAKETRVINKPLKVAKERQQHATMITENIQNQQPTPKEDLYIQPPKYPRFDTTKVWLKQVVGSDTLVIYTTLPEIPTRQNEISVTTRLESMTDKELMNLYPNHLIRTRSSRMYDEVEGLSYDEDLGVIIPVEGFTEDQVIDNIIRYPHLYKLRKIDRAGQPSNFYKTLEINGELYPIEEIWDELPESKKMPKDSEFAKEYIVRRYLLEEAAGIQHKYKMVGTLDPFLTVFMTPLDYVKRGYKDTLGIVKQCVSSRIRYKQSRNPILRRVGLVNV